MRLLVTGSHGQLGRELLARTAPDPNITTIGIDIDDCNIVDPDDVERVMTDVKPEVVINCAAWTAVDAAETAEDAAAAVNVTGPANLAAAASRHGARLCHISTDFVFDGTATTPITEDAPPNPLGAYGRTKLAGEVAVRSALAEHQIVRTAWLYGQTGPNFVLTMIRLAKERDELQVVDDQRGTPTWTGHLAPTLLRLIARPEYGTFHVTNSGETTWRGFAAAALAECGFATHVVGISSEQFASPTPRPAYSVLDNRRWLSLGEQPLPPWQEGLSEYIAEQNLVQEGH